MLRLFPRLLLLTWMFTATVSAADQTQDYRDARFGYSVTYPMAFFGPPKTDNGNLVLDANSGRGSLSIGAYAPPLRSSAKYRFDEAISNLLMEAKVTYRRQKDNWFVISAVADRTATYKKEYVVGDVVYWMTFEFPEADLKQWVPVIDQVAPTFTPGPGISDQPKILPELKAGEGYDVVRRKMQTAGWKPVRAKEPPMCVVNNDARCIGRPEVEECSGFGRSYCLFVWRKGGYMATLQTAGELNPPGLFSVDLERK